MGNGHSSYFGKLYVTEDGGEVLSTLPIVQFENYWSKTRASRNIKN